MKKMITMMMVAVLAFSMLAGCGSTKTTGSVATTVAQNPGAIVYASVASVKDNTVKAVTVDSVAPTEETIKDGIYVVQRPFVLVTKADVELSEATHKFFDYITSTDTNKIISAAGVVSVNQEIRRCGETENCIFGSGR